ncbi:calphotin-like [Scaptodrosophila lebanonensis]|uniref:Calphotin-like n=1 Tax=Drosophila lebanonensis TaxID=7225 RepID=A0A6J2TP33_DROLE|nr:calphotin-like [Scaptodrosophila lebanonensis]
MRLAVRNILLLSCVGLSIAIGMLPIAAKIAPKAIGKTILGGLTMAKTLGPSFTKLLSGGQPNAGVNQPQNGPAGQAQEFLNKGVETARTIQTQVSNVGKKIVTDLSQKAVSLGMSPAQVAKATEIISGAQKQANTLFTGLTQGVQKALRGPNAAPQAQQIEKQAQPVAVEQVPVAFAPTIQNAAAAEAPVVAQDQIQPISMLQAPVAYDPNAVPAMSPMAAQGQPIGNLVQPLSMQQAPVAYDPNAVPVVSPMAAQPVAIQQVPAATIPYAAPVVSPMAVQGVPNGNPSVQYIAPAAVQQGIAPQVVPGVPGPAAQSPNIVLARTPGAPTNEATANQPITKPA